MSGFPEDTDERKDLDSMVTESEDLVMQRRRNTDPFLDVLKVAAGTLLVPGYSTIREYERHDRSTFGAAILGICLAKDTLKAAAYSFGLISYVL